MAHSFMMDSVAHARRRRNVAAQGDLSSYRPGARRHGNTVQLRGFPRACFGCAGAPQAGAIAGSPGCADVTEGGVAAAAAAAGAFAVTRTGALGIAAGTAPRDALGRAITRVPSLAGVRADALATGAG